MIIYTSACIQITSCGKSIENFLSSQFGTTYDKKGITCLMNDGVEGDQILHLDSCPDCKCNELFKKVEHKHLKRIHFF